VKDYLSELVRQTSDALRARNSVREYLVMLNNALHQTGWTGGRLTSRTWPRAVEAKVAQSSWETAQKDVRPFLETTSEVALLSRENLLQVVRSRSAGRQGKRGK